MKDIILSIKPQFSSQIYLGNRKVELRKRLSPNVKAGNKVFIYSSSPVQQLDGVATIESIEHFNPVTRRDSILPVSGISAAGWDAYYAGRSQGLGLWLTDVQQFSNPLPLSVLKTAGFTPPQSFTFGTDAIWSLITTYTDQ